MKAVRMIIAGGRDFADYQLLLDKVDSLCVNMDVGDMEIVSGGARGADALGERYAKDNNFPCRRFPADWDAHGRRAGFIRNEQMAKYATHCVCFWDGKSSGTASMIELARQYGLKLRVVRY